MHTATTQVATEVQAPPETECENAVPAEPETAVSQTRAHTRIQTLCTLAGNDVFSIYELYRASSEFASSGEEQMILTEILKEALAKIIHGTATPIFPKIAEILCDLENSPLNNDQFITNLLTEACRDKGVMDYLWWRFDESRFRGDRRSPRSRHFLQIYLEKTCGDDLEKARNIAIQYGGLRRHVCEVYTTKLQYNLYFTELERLKGDFHALVQFGRGFMERHEVPYDDFVKEFTKAIDETVTPIVTECGDDLDRLIDLYNTIPFGEGVSKINEAIQKLVKPLITACGLDFSQLSELYNRIPRRCREEIERTMEGAMNSMVEGSLEDFDQLLAVYQYISRNSHLLDRFNNLVREECKKDLKKLFRLIKSPLAERFVDLIIYYFVDLLEMPESANIDVVCDLLRLHSFILVTRIPDSKTLFEQLLPKYLRDLIKLFITHHQKDFNTLFYLYYLMSPEQRNDFPEVKEAACQTTSLKCDLADLADLYKALEQERTANVIYPLDDLKLERLEHLANRIPPELKGNLTNQVRDLVVRRVRPYIDASNDLESLHDLTSKLWKTVENSNFLCDIVLGETGIKADRLLTVAIREAKQDFAQLEKIIKECPDHYKLYLREVIRRQLTDLIAVCGNDLSKVMKLYSMLPEELQSLVAKHVRIEQAPPQPD